MRKKFVQVLVVALAAFAMLVFAYPDDDLSDLGVGLAGGIAADTAAVSDRASLTSGEIPSW